MSGKEITPTPKYLKDYKRSDFLIKTVDFTFDLYDEKTLVTSRLHLLRTQDRYTQENAPLVLDGKASHLKLLEVRLNGTLLSASDYKVDEEGLTLTHLPDDFMLEIKNEINPKNNKTLEGLYKSGDIFCTQNEPEGMRHTCYFLDRSDVMAIYTTKVIADKRTYPILLSNGNKIEEGECGNGRHFVVWNDPFPKPSYLFALVAGDLDLVQDHFVTMSGRKIDLRIYCDKGDAKKCLFAMDSLKSAMKWDEEKFGLEYDLDIYMIVAVSSFNQGAMENKGLNVFNSVAVMGQLDTTTDAEFQYVDSTVAHEYFHNWTGNRVTCRDWFQLTLKEGLTVFRDHLFCLDRGDASVARIQQVIQLRRGQFSEDASPLAHPIRPESFIEINNFYTHTIYSKGCEVIWMVKTILGDELFAKGMKRYFELYDGQAVTTEDFLHAMELASGIDLTPFKRWYDQAGTPEVHYTYQYDAMRKQFLLHLKQTCPPTPEAKIKAPFWIPLKVGLVDEKGKDLIETKLIHLKEREQTIVLEGVSARAIPSINRGFSAPIKVNSPLTLKDQIHLASFDSDSFNRWDSFQEASKVLMLSLVKMAQKGELLTLPLEYEEAFGHLLRDQHMAYAFKGLVLQLPTTQEIAEEMAVIDYLSTHKVREWMLHRLASLYEKEMAQAYEKLKKVETPSLSAEAMGERAFKNLLLQFLSVLNKREYEELSYEQFKKPLTMTDHYSSFKVLVDRSERYAEEAIHSFFERFKNDSLTLCKWFSIQSTSIHDKTFPRVKGLAKHPSFDRTVPNLTRSLLLYFTTNPLHFHDLKGEGYRFIADQVLEIDKFNPLVAARLASGFSKIKKMDKERKLLMDGELQRILSQKVSPNLYEIVHNYRTL